MPLSPRQRVQKTLRREETDRVPWVPFVGCHAASLLGISAEQYLRSEDLIVRGVREAVQRYQPDGIPVTFDLQIEAEALGCELKWAADNPPAVVSHPLEGGRRAVADLAVPGPEAGRVGMMLAAARRTRAEHPDLALYGLITGPFTLALHLMGTEIFMTMFDDPPSVHELLAFCRRVGESMCDGYLAAGCDVLAVVDPMTSQIGPEQFREFVAPCVTPLFDRVRAAGRLGSFFVCGHAQQNIRAMCDCRPDNISIDENIPLDYVRDVCTEGGISFGGNMQLTTVLLLGSETEAEKNALACMETGGRRGFVLSPGCDLPYATPAGNLQAVARLVGDPYRQEVVRAMAEEEMASDVLDMSDYGEADKVIVDVITLDSEACAPCQYMVEAVRAVSPQYEGIVQWREHKIKYRESLRFMTSLMVRNVPTICIDGQITFTSRIPRREELIAAIQRRIYEKLRVKIQRRHASLYVLGEDTPKTRLVLDKVRQAVTELGAEIEVQLVQDPEAFYSYGLAPVQTPAVVLARYQVKSAGHVPEVSIIKEWIKDLQ